MTNRCLTCKEIMTDSMPRYYGAVNGLFFIPVVPESHANRGETQSDTGGKHHARQPLRPSRVWGYQGKNTDDDEPE